MIDADEFLATIFAGAEGAVVIAKPFERRGYFQRLWRHGDAATLKPGAWYWCCSTSNAASKVNRDDVATITRRKVDLGHTHAIVLDDVGTKVEAARVKQMLPPPSAIIETSPSNYQWVYNIDGGCVPTEAEAALEQLAAAGLTDAGAKDAAHIFRLPGSINDKPAVRERNGGEAWPARVTLWEPDRRYIVQEIVERVPPVEPKKARKVKVNGQTHRYKLCGDHGLDILGRHGLVVTERGDGVDIRCPWRELHSDATSDSATTYWPPKSGKPPGFKCLHGHCVHRDIHDLHSWMRAMDPTFGARLSPHGDAEPLGQGEPKGNTNGGQQGKSNGQQQQRRSRWLGVHLPDIRYEPGAHNWLIEGLLPARGLAVLFARWKSYKSFIALDLSMAIARADQWAGRKVKPGAVVYVAAEGALGLRKRIAAYQARYPGDRSPFYLMELRPALGTRPGDMDLLLAGIRATVGKDVAVALVALDTTARMIGSEDENNEGMRAFTDNAEDISDELECLVLAVHHENAAGDRRTRGATSLPGAAVALWRAEKTKDGDERCCKITIEDAKDSADGTTLLLRFDVHDFGEPEPGHERETTLIARSVEIVGATPGEVIDKTKRTSIPRNQAAFMTAFEQALESHGLHKRPWKDGPYVHTVPRELVRGRWDIIRADLKNEETRKRKFNEQLGRAVGREDLITRERDGETLLWKPKK